MLKGGNGPAAIARPSAFRECRSIASCANARDNPRRDLLQLLHPLHDANSPAVLQLFVTPFELLIGLPVHALGFWRERVIKRAYLT